MRLFLISLLLLPLLAAQAREFTDIEGRKISAELTAHLGDSVEIQRGAQKFWLPVSRFSEDDQAFIRNWIEQNPTKLGYSFKYYFDLSEMRGQSRSSEGTMIDDRLKHHPQEYEVIVYNTSKVDYEGVDIRYEVYVNDMVDTKNNRYASLATGTEKKDKLQAIPGKISGVSIPAEGRVDFTAKFDIQSYVDRDGGKIDQHARDSVIGFRIRIFKENVLLDEYVDEEDESRMKTAGWVGEEAKQETPLD